MRRALATSAALVGLSSLWARTAEAAPRKVIHDACEGCLATAPEGDEPVPLLVTLHGDWGYMAPELHRAWERFAAPRGVALLSLACPAKLGCKRSWWQWNGDPSWIVAQVDHLATMRAIDRDRMWIAGWSGGASYIGMRTQEIERSFAGIVIHGGGVWPWPDDCPATKARVVFLVGDRNPLHKNGLALRDHYARCGNELTFHLLPGAEHESEWKALAEKGGAILDTLATARMSRAASPTSGDAMGPPPIVGASASPTASAPARATEAPQPPAVTTPRVPPHAGCGCDAASHEGAPRGARVAALVGALALVVRRRMTRGRRVEAGTPWHTR
ncbi:MAG: hypothetical protein JST00_47170 [Deltaproteobacteria bacterium]|nr:hypothetical protein [Deltaproteobacteria bacterium]